MARLPIKETMTPPLPLLGYSLAVGGKGEPLLPWRLLVPQFSPAQTRLFLDALGQGLDTPYLLTGL